MRVLPESLAICRLAADSDVPPWARSEAASAAGLRSLTFTEAELSIVCAAAAVPAEVEAERGWRALEVEGPLAFELVGVLAGLATTLAAASISIFALSSFATDYVLVPEDQLARARTALEAAGYSIE